MRRAAGRYDELSEALVAAWPCQRDLDIILKISVGCAGFIHKHFDGMLANSLGSDGDSYYLRARTNELRNAEYYYLGRFRGQ